MSYATGTYDSQEALQASLERILHILKNFGVTNVYVKKLAPNDNSKNQPYFGSHLTDVAFIPTGETKASDTVSAKPNAKRKIKYQTSINLSWFDFNGQVYKAPYAKLIYYPQYPEVRFSGFLRDSDVDASRWMLPEREGRAEGRWLILGVSPDKNVYAYLVTPESSLAAELNDRELVDIGSVFFELPSQGKVVRSAKEELLFRLRAINQSGWIAGKKLTKSGVIVPYSAPNSGGYTLEAELGISPNGVAEPDFLGWEVKQFGVKRFPGVGARPTTLMTPEPNGGFYVENSVLDFVREYGYSDKSGKVNRLNFGGKHVATKVCSATKLTLTLTGFNALESSILDAEGALQLIDACGVVAASWSFAKLIDHWKTKHAQAVYVPAMRRQVQGKGCEYHFGKDIELGTGTNFELFLSAMANCYVYYDPGIKVEGNNTDNPIIKRRSQFRVNHRHLGKLYEKFEKLDLTDEKSG